MKKVHLILLLIFSFVLGNVSAQSVTICNGKYSKRYHTSADCSGLNNCKGGLSTVSLSDAVRMGRTPCQTCHPRTLSPGPNSNNNNNNNKIKNSEAVSVQCSATTKAGTRCKRMTKSPNGLCWQHGGD